MKISPHISIALQQKTAPKNLMRQLVKLLPMNETQLLEAIQFEAEQNPFLSFDSTEVSTGNVDFDDIQIENQQSSIYQILMPQIQVRFPESQIHSVAIDILSCLDEDGFLRDSLTHIQEKYPKIDIFNVLTALQELHPVGVFSRNMQEFYTTYLKSEGKFSGLWKTVVENLDILSQGNTKPVIAQLGLDGENILQQLLQDLRDLPRHPDIETAKTEIVIPDLQVKKIQGEWHVKVISNLHTRLHIDDSYVKDIRKQTNKKQDKVFITQKFTSAKWLKTALQMRAETLQKVGVVIIQHQNTFLDGGDVLPLTLQQVADKASVHISTISRIIKNKYIICPMGTMPLTMFFSNKVHGNISQHTICKEIQNIVNTEAEQKTIFSDDALVKILAEKGIKVARRTIAKYRKMLNIPPSHTRKRGLKNRGII